MKYQTRRSPQEWEQLIQEQEQSEESQKAFCLKRNISYASFCKWRNKLKNRNSEFLPISTHEIPDASGRFSLTMGWGKFSLSMSFC